MPRTRATQPSTQRRRRRTWIIVIAAAVVLLGGAGLIGWRVLGTGAATTTTTERTTEVTQQTLKDTVGTTGTVEPKQRADLSFASSGTVTKVYVSVGDKVIKGDRLATIDDDDLQADLDAAEADDEAADDDLTTAQDDADTTDAELSAAESKVAVTQSKVSQAKKALAAATLRSTIDGTVALVDIAKGDSVRSSSAGSASGGSTSSASSSAAVTVISTNRFTVASSVGSADLAKIKPGLQAEITPTGASQAIYGTVASVAVMASSSGSGTTGTTDASSATFDVSIDVTGEQKTLYAGASATVSIIVKQRTDVLTVPTAAVSTVDGKTVVNKLVDGAKVVTEVKLGESYGPTTEVTSGLAAGDQVVVTITPRNGGGTGTGTGQNRNGYAQNGQNGGFPAGGEPPAGAQQGGPGTGTQQGAGTR